MKLLKRGQKALKIACTFMYKLKIFWGSMTARLALRERVDTDLHNILSIVTFKALRRLSCHTQTQKRARMHTHTHTRTHTGTHAQLHSRLPPHTHTQTHVHTRVCKRIYTFTNTQTHTVTHAHTGMQCAHTLTQTQRHIIYYIIAESHNSSRDIMIFVNGDLDLHFRGQLI